MLLSPLRLGRTLPGLLRAFPLPRPAPHTLTLTRKMNFHTFAGNPLKDRVGTAAAAESLSSLLRGDAGGDSHKILPLMKGRPLAYPDTSASWQLFWVSTGFANFPSESFVYLGSSSEAVHCWAFDANDEKVLTLGINLGEKCNFVELRTLMHAADWRDERAMEDLAIAGHVGFN